MYILKSFNTFSKLVFFRLDKLSISVGKTYTSYTLCKRNAPNRT